MGSTALFTFLFEHPTRVQSVDLLGSWDNFSKPYPLQRDRRRGHGVWSGCYTFENIICDGDLENVGQRRSGALKMGGTYWYYYSIDGVEERHNPSEPSTTACPLLPGQRLNLLEVPRESGSAHTMEDVHVFTRNPKDKFLTPVPPVPTKAIPSPRLGHLCSEPYRVPMVSLPTPRSATYPHTSPAYSPGTARHVRSQSSTPPLSSSALIADFKSLKEKFAQKRAASHARVGSRNIRDLEIGAPTLISTTAEEVAVVPLASLNTSPFTSPLATPHTSKSLPTLPIASPSASDVPAFVNAKLRQFSPLGSHPIEPASISTPSPFTHLEDSSCGARPRSRSDVALSSAGSFCAPSSVVRANSTDTRRTKLFCNEPWISSPRLPRHNELELVEIGAEAPVLERDQSSLRPFSTDPRPTSSHGEDPTSGSRDSSFNKDKDLPPLPRYLVPAPLYACNSTDSSPRMDHVPEENDRQEIRIEDASFQMLSKHNGHFSIWSAESGTFSSPTSDDDANYSPTLSSSTSECSDNGSPHRFSQFSISDHARSLGQDYEPVEETDSDKSDSAADDDVSTLPPMLGKLDLPSFGPNLFDLDIQHAESAPRRQAACFGLGFQSYRLPEDGITFKATVNESSLRTQPAVQHAQGGSINHPATLLDDFGFLGDAVN